MLDVSIQGGCILPADDPLWNQSAHCQGAYGHGEYMVVPLLCPSSKQNKSLS